MTELPATRPNEIYSNLLLSQYGDTDCRNEKNEEDNEDQMQAAWHDCVTSTYALSSAEGCEVIPLVVLSSPCQAKDEYRVSFDVNELALPEETKDSSVPTDIATYMQYWGQGAEANREYCNCDCSSTSTLSTIDCTVSDEVEIDWTLDDDEARETQAIQCDSGKKNSLPRSMSPCETAVSMDRRDDDYFTEGFIHVGDLPRIH